MIEHIINNVIGYAALGLFVIGTYEWYRNSSKKEKESIQKALNITTRNEINAELKKLDEAVIDKQKAYKNAKDKVYEILNKRNSSSSDNNSSDKS